MPDSAPLTPSHPSWVVLWATAIGFLVRLLKSERVPPPLDKIPAKARPIVALFLGQFSGALVAAALPGVTWQDAAVSGLWAAALAVVGHDVLIEYLRAGKEPLQATPPVEIPPAARVTEDALEENTGADTTVLGADETPAPGTGRSTQPVAAEEARDAD